MNENEHQKETRFWELFFLPVGCLMNLSPWFMFIFIVIIATSGLLVFHNVNSTFGGLTAIDYTEIEFSKSKETVWFNGSEWAISYESNKKTVFDGTVRHVSPMRMGKYPLLTHDILVTTGDFANPELVNTSVMNHMFTWKPKGSFQPSGTINLLHTVPLNAEIYASLWTVRNGQKITVTGYEILRISALSERGETTGWWEDHGCNTILITAVSVE